MCVVMAAGGYPGAYRSGDAIEGLAEAGKMRDVVVFHAGTKKSGEQVVTAGGRILGVTALGHDLEEAVKRVYEAVSKIRFQDAHYRHDIAQKALR